MEHTPIMTLTPSGYRPRLIDPLISDYPQSFGAISIEGPRYCGKTWTALHHANSSFMIADPKYNHSNKNRALIDVSSIFEGEEPRLIDEWQEVPTIWDATRFEVDKSSKKRKTHPYGILYTRQRQNHPQRCRTYRILEDENHVVIRDGDIRWQGLPPIPVRFHILEFILG